MDKIIYKNLGVVHGDMFSHTYKILLPLENPNGRKILRKYKKQETLVLFELHSFDFQFLFVGKP